MLQLPAEVHHEVLKAVHDTNPDALDVLLRRKLHGSGGNGG